MGGKVRHHGESGGVAGRDAGGLLSLFIDDEEVDASAGGEEGCPEFESVDLNNDLEVAASLPEFLNAEW
jgi:hypothetical protein